MANAAKQPERGPVGGHAAADAAAAPSSKLGEIMRRLKWPYLVGIAVGLGLMTGAAFYLLREPEKPPAEQLLLALASLDEHRNVTARKFAQHLREEAYEDPDFPGGVDYVLGVVAFRRAIEDADFGREKQFLAAVSHLREAERLSLPAARRPEWSFALGISLHRLGLADEALPLLEETVHSFPSGAREAAFLLTEMYLDTRSRRQMAKGLSLNGELLADADLRVEERDRAYMQRAQLLFSLDRRVEAEAALEKVSRESSRNQGMAVLRAQTAMSDGKFREAQKMLELMADDHGLDRAYPAQASYLLGVCAEQLRDFEDAVAFYQRTIERFEETHEAVAGRVGAASALRRLGRNEEALEMYSGVLRSIRQPRSFRNRWFSLKKLQEQLLDAWNSWMEHNYYDEAITLAEMMSPAVPREQALELVARANQRWAEHLEAEIGAVPSDRLAAKQAELHERWRRSGLAYYRLAENRKSSTEFLNAVWMSAEDYLKGQDYENAAARLTQFIEGRQLNLLPAALVRRGQCYLSLDRTDEGLRDFREVIAIAPTDPAAFQSRYLIGQCHLERDEIDLAERAWRSVLDLPDLTPTALEWRKSLYSLGKLLFDTAELMRRKQGRAGGLAVTTVSARTDASSAQDDTLQLRFEEAISRLQEYRDRYPASEEAAEVRFMLAQALQRSAEFPEAGWRNAETENARTEFRRQMQERLERAVVEYQQLQQFLLTKQGAGHLESQGQAMLRNCFFDIAGCYFSLGKYEDSIAAYSVSAGRYQSDADSLTAYVQIANCYDRLKKPAEALSTLAQARLILKNLPDGAFPAGPSAMSREDWRKWLEWAMKLHQ